jgi:hypothetical protein
MFDRADIGRHFWVVGNYVETIAKWFVWRTYMKMALKFVYIMWMACFRTVACVLLWRLFDVVGNGDKERKIPLLSFSRECNVQSIPMDNGEHCILWIYIYMPLYNSDEDAI